MADAVQIRSELTLEDLTSEVLRAVQGELGKTQQEVEQTEDSFGQFAQATVQFLHNIGVDLMNVGRQVLDFGKSFVVAASAGESADTALAGLITTVQNIPFDQAIADSKDLADELDEIQATTGARGDIGAAFQQLALFTGASADGIEAASDRIYDMSEISRVLGRDVGSVTQEFAMMMEGTLKVKGQLFQLLQSTGNFGNDAKKAAAAWGTLTEAKRVEILNASLEQVVGNFKDIPKTFDNQIASLESIFDVAKEEIGEPFMEALVPAVEEATDSFIEMRPELIELAQTIGKDVGRWVKQGIQLFRDGVQWMRTNYDEIRDALVKGWGFAKDVMSFIVANKEVILALAAARAGNQFTQGVIGGLQANEAAKKNPADPGAKLGKLAAAADAATLAIMAWSVALDQWTKLMREYKEIEEDRKTGQNEIKKQLAEAGEAGDVDRVLELYERRDNAPDKSNTVALEHYDAALERAEQVADEVEQQADDYISAMDAAAFNVSDAFKQAGATHTAASQEYAVKFADEGALEIIQAYNWAIQNNQVATAQFAASTIEGSAHLQEAFLTSGQMIEGGIENFALMLNDQGSEFAKKLGTLSGNELPGKSSKTNFNLTGSGSVTINVKQDFRNQDPDRVAIAFQRDVQRMAERRFMASTSTPFGT